MFVWFVVLTVISGITLIIGFIWMLTASGKTTRRSGPEVGAEIMGGSAGDDDEAGITLLEKSVFAGKAVAVEREAEVSYTDIKRMVRERRWRAALPPLLAMIGLSGLVVFGALALWVKLDDKLVATLIVAVVLFTMGRVAHNFRRS